ncbi:universal stress protein [Fusibacter paucivorans]|uniref:Universal stress protein n=1 Tax=Fusibacter paucivorans TaxID=76009 RepID=A0ABS5PM95_9FIRM|nr:universal stress protein [Fusibacter paucivorans]MBS7525486.1 universal stress protein [Fusibacter paucivorans]
MRKRKKFMVCVTQQKSCERLIAYGASRITSENDELHVIHVVKENWKYFGKLEETDALEYLFDVSKKHHASLSVMKAKDIETTLATYAEKNKITNIIMGSSKEKDDQQNMINRLQERTRIQVKFEIVPITDEEDIDIIEVESVIMG